MAPVRFSRHRSLAAALAVLALLGCSSDPGDERSTTTVDATTQEPGSSSTSTSAAEAQAVRIVAGGDSMMYDTSPGLAAALDPEVATVVELLVPTLHAPSSRLQLERALTEAPTDVVVLMVGVWETGYETQDGLALEDPGWDAGYRAEVLDPLVELVAGHGAHLVLVQEPPMRVDAASAKIAALAAPWEVVAAERPEDVTSVDSRTWLDVGPGYVEVATDPTGAEVRIRRVDGIHFCREGVVRLVTGMVDLVDSLVDEAWGPRFVPGWETGPWADRFPPEECPPVGGSS